MDHNILRILFLDNPELPFEVAEFCKTVPKYVQAEREYDLAVQEIQQILGLERYCRYEECLNRIWAAENNAYYLFGLGLRKDILQALNPSL